MINATDFTYLCCYIVYQKSAYKHRDLLHTFVHDSMYESRLTGPATKNNVSI